MIDEATLDLLYKLGLTKIAVAPDGAGLEYECFASADEGALLLLLRQHKPALLALLRATGELSFPLALERRASVRSALAQRDPGTEATEVTEVRFSASECGAREQKTPVTEGDRCDRSLPACPHPWHEMYYLQRALARVLPAVVEARIEIYPAPLRLRLTRRDTGDMLDIPHRDLARIASPGDPALATNAAAVIDAMLDVWRDLAPKEGER